MQPLAEAYSTPPVVRTRLWPGASPTLPAVRVRALAEAMATPAAEKARQWAAVMAILLAALMQWSAAAGETPPAAMLLPCQVARTARPRATTVSLPVTRPGPITWA